MADVNINFKADENLDKLKKDLQAILKLVKDIKKSDIIGEDEAVRAKKLTAEMLKVENAIKRQEGIAGRLATQESKRVSKLQQEKGIIGGLEKEVKDLTAAWKRAGTAIDKATAKKKLDGVKKQLTDAKNTTASWGKALGSFQFKFNALGNIASTVLSSMTRQAKEFAKDAVRMALEIQGVRNAFDKINDPNLLANLQRATRGTVNNLELMKTAVLAKNFKIPLAQLETFLQFAGDRALDTGEDFGFLVDSIVKGLGRKSVLILDNLGLSVIEINKEVKKTGNFMEAAAIIIQREMEAAGDVLSTDLVTAKQLTAEIENLKLAVGEFALQPDRFGVLNVLIEDIATIADFFERRTNVALKDAQRRLQDFSDTLKDKSAEEQLEAVNEKIKETDVALEFERKRYKALDRQSKETRGKQKRDIEDVKDASLEGAEALRLEIELLEREKKAIEDAVNANNEKENTLKKLRTELKSLQELRELSDVSELAGINKTITALQTKIKEYENLGKEIEPIKILQVKEVKDDFDDLGEALSEFGDFIDEEQKKTDEKNKNRSEIVKARREKDDKEEIDDFRDKENQKKSIFNSINSALTASSSSFFSAKEAQVDNFYDAEIEAAQGNEAKIKQIQKERAEAEQELAVKRALIDGALAIVKTFTSYGGFTPAALIAAASQAVVTGVQVAAIKAQKFEHGGMVGGQLHSQGGTQIEAEKGEYVINRQSTSKYKDLLDGINDNDQLKILSAMDKDRMKPVIKSDPYPKKLYDYFMSKEEYGETGEWWIINKGTTKTMIRKDEV